MKLERQRGFAVPEMFISLAIVAALALVSLATIQIFARVLAARSSAQGGTIALEQQVEAMRGDAATAYAIFVPQKDVEGQPNAAAPAAGTVPSGHEVDFYSRTDAGLETWWAYRYDAAAHTVQRYDYDASGNVGVADRNTGLIDKGAHYPALTGVESFSAAVLEAGQLTSAPNVFAPLIVGLASITPQSEPVGFVPKSGTSRADLYGGNVTVQISIATDHGARMLHLASAALPSGFTIHQVPSIRAVTYRIDTVHRSWFGLAQITHAQIFNQLLYSYDPSAPPNKWHVWCDYEVFGSKTTGLRLGDINTKYHENYFVESAPGIYYSVTNVGPVGKNGTSGMNEQPGCHHPLPSAHATPYPVATATDPDVIDTPPPCFSAGTCWPDNAPPNWTPPSPWPLTTPPAGWCASHNESPLCGGAGGTPPPATSDSPPPAAYYSPSPDPNTSDGSGGTTVPRVQ